MEQETEDLDVMIAERLLVAGEFKAANRRLLASKRLRMGRRMAMEVPKTQRAKVNKTRTWVILP